MGLTSSVQFCKNSQGRRRTAILDHRATLIGVLGFSLLITPMAAQERSSNGATVPNTRSPLDEIQSDPVEKATPHAGGPNDVCLLPPLSLIQNQVVAAKDLAVPAKAKKEYLAGCAALRKSKFEDAEKHLRKAVEQYSEYPTAWTTLGQLLSAEKHNDQARAACSKASAVQTSYMPAYLCLADIAAQEEAWSQVLQFSSQALQVAPTAVAYLYNAAASLKIHNLDEAEQSALRALAMDKENSDPRGHFVLAQIYEAKGDRPKEISELREYLKFIRNPEDIAYVKQSIARLEKSGAAHTDPAAHN